MDHIVLLLFSLKPPNLLFPLKGFGGGCRWLPPPKVRSLLGEQPKGTKATGSCPGQWQKAVATTTPFSHPLSGSYQLHFFYNSLNYFQFFEEIIFGLLILGDVKEILRYLDLDKWSLPMVFFFSLHPVIEEIGKSLFCCIQEEDWILECLI